MAALNEEAKKVFLKYRYKTRNAKLYNAQMKEIQDAFTMREWLEDLHHDVHINKCESINDFSTKVLHKNKHWCHSID